MREQRWGCSGEMRIPGFWFQMVVVLATRRGRGGEHGGDDKSEFHFGCIQFEMPMGHLEEVHSE